MVPTPFSSDRQRLDRLLKDLDQNRFHSVNTFIRVWIKSLRISSICDVEDIIHESYPIALKMIEDGKQRDCWIPTLKRIALNKMKDKSKKMRRQEIYISTQTKMHLDQHNNTDANMPLKYSEILDKIGIQSPKDRIILILRSQGFSWDEVAQELVVRGYEPKDSGLVERVKKYGNRLIAKLRGRISPEDFE